VSRNRSGAPAPFVAADVPCTPKMR